MYSISDLERRLEELPILPTIIVRLLALNTDDENYFEHVLELAQSDPTFALRVIRLSNSVTSSPINPITGLNEAIVRLGVNTVASLVSSMAVIRVFLPSTQGEKNLWIHSIQVAEGAKIMAQAMPSLNVAPEHAYLCGLLHDIGRFVLFDKAASDLNLVEETHWQSPTQLIQVERELYGFSHSELGHRVCQKWGLPQTIIDVVTYHHEQTLPLAIAENSSLAHLIRIVQLADFFSVLMMLNPDALCWEPAKFEKALHDQCVRPSSPSSPLSAKQLQLQANEIIDASNKKIFGLGLA